MIHEDVWTERVDACVGHRREHRRSRIGELPHRPDTLRPEPGRVHQVVEERRDEVKGGDLLGVDQRERQVRAPVRLADEAAVHRGHARERVDAHGVVERHDAERALAPSVAALDHVGERARVVVRCVLGTPLGRPVVPEV